MQRTRYYIRSKALAEYEPWRETSQVDYWNALSNMQREPVAMRDCEVARVDPEAQPVAEVQS